MPDDEQYRIDKQQARRSFDAAAETYDEARGHVRTCDVCVLALGDAGPKADVYFCPSCDAWICEACRRRYDLRAIAALKRRVLRGRPPA